MNGVAFMIGGDLKWLIKRIRVFHKERKHACFGMLINFVFEIFVHVSEEKRNKQKMFQRYGFIT